MTDDARKQLADLYESRGNKAAAFTLRQVGPVGIVLETALEQFRAGIQLGRDQAAEWLRTNMARVGPHNANIVADTMLAELSGDHIQAGNG